MSSPPQTVTSARPLFSSLRKFSAFRISPYNKEVKSAFLIMAAPHPLSQRTENRFFTPNMNAEGSRNHSHPPRTKVSFIKLFTCRQ